MIGKALTALVCLAGSGPAISRTIASPAAGTAINASGTLTVDVLGLYKTTCNITMSGIITSAGTATTAGEITFTSGTSTGLGCSFPGTRIDYPLIFKTTGYLTWNTGLMTVRTSVADCYYNNMTIFSNGFYNIHSTNIASGPCKITLNVDTNLVIVVNP